MVVASERGFMAVATAGLDESTTKGESSDWRYVFLNRYLSDFSENENSPRTKQAEHGYGWGEQSYWYIDRVVDTYARALLVWRIDPAACARCVTLPFDSGGLWHNYFATAANATDEQKREFITEDSSALPRGADFYQKWVETAFVDAADYVDGRTPPTHDASHSGVLDVANPFTWSWELRHEKGVECQALTLDVGFMTRNDDKVFWSHFFDDSRLDDGTWDALLSTYPKTIQIVETLSGALDAAIDHVASRQDG
jgi:hypothetical protein